MRSLRSTLLRPLSRAGLVAVLTCFALPGIAAQPANTQFQANAQASTNAQKAADLTTALMALQHRWHAAQANEKSQALKQLIAQADARQQLLSKLAETDPAAVLRVAIPADKQQGMPAEVQQRLEKKVGIEGKSEAVFADNKDGTHKLHQFLTTASGERYELHFAKKTPRISTGTTVHADGLLLASRNGDTNGELVLGSQDNLLTLELSSSTTGGSNGGSPAASNTFGEQKTLVILVNFQDKADQPYTLDYARQVIFGDTSDYFRESSYGQTWLAGDVTGWYTLPMDSTVCQDNTLRDYANTAATNAGVDLSAYDRLVYAFPQNACAYWGTASVGGAPSYALINGPLELAVTGHEMGHNFGLYHSHSLKCADGTSIGAGSPDLWSTDPWTGCSNVEYGDGVDTMGWSDSGHTNAFQKERLGWLNYNQSPPLTTVTQSGTYTIAPYSAQDGNVKALKVLKSPADQYGYRTWYYIEYRQPIGYDSTFASSTSMMDANNVLNGVTVHVGYEGNDGANVYLLDMTPQTNSDLYTRDPALPVGATYTDANAGVSITTDSSDASGATVTVSIAGTQQTCVPATPSVSLTPGQSAWLTSGSSYSYTLTLTNNDSSACASNSFSLAAALPSGWSGSLGAQTLTLAPGASASTAINVTSSASATNGFYDISVTASSGAYNATATATFAIDNPTSTNSAPVALNDTATISTLSAVTIPVLANDYDPDNDSIQLYSVTQPAKGTVQVNNDGTITYTPGKPFKSSDSFTYTITDGSSTAQATVTISLQSTTTTSGSSGGGKGKGSHK